MALATMLKAHAGLVNLYEDLASCPTAGSLLNLTSHTCLNQQVFEPTRNCNILDLIFCLDNIINSITISNTFLSDHRVIYAETLIPVHEPSTSSD